jgi:hypothetical protein
LAQWGGGEVAPFPAPTGGEFAAPELPRLALMSNAQFASKRIDRADRRPADNHSTEGNKLAFAAVLLLAG